MSKIGKKIPCRSCLTEAILVIGKKIVRFKMFDEVGIKQSFENLGNSRSESNRAIVGGVRAVTLLRYRLNKFMLPRRRISTGNKDVAKKTTKNRRQFLSKFLLAIIVYSDTTAHPDCTACSPITAHSVSSATHAYTNRATSTAVSLHSATHVAQPIKPAKPPQLVEFCQAAQSVLPYLLTLCLDIQEVILDLHAGPEPDASGMRDG